MKRTLLLLFVFTITATTMATEKVLNSSGSTGRWVKIARIQNANPISGGECANFSGTINVQTDYGQSANQQYFAIFSFGSRGTEIRPLLQEFGDAANRPQSDPSRIEWRIYTDSQGWHYLWFWQSNYSIYAIFDYGQSCSTEYWTYENPPASYSLVWSSSNGPRQGSAQSIESLSVYENVGIGVTDTGGYKLAVKGKIRAEEIKVETGWADYVFKNDYILPTLQEVEEHIKKKGHLINIPSEEEIKANGVALGNMNKLLLEKIEELTLYTIQQQKSIDLYQSQLEMLTQKLEKLEQQITNQKN